MKYLVVLLGSLFMVSCTEPVVQKPENLISEKKMVEIYFDVSLINASRNSGYDKFQQHGIDSQKYLYEKHAVDSAQLAESAKYYTSLPLVHERIYAQVEKKLDSLKSHFDGQLDELQDQRDKIDAVIDSMEVEKEARELREPVSGDSL